MRVRWFLVGAKGEPSVKRKGWFTVTFEHLRTPNEYRLPHNRLVVSEWIRKLIVNLVGRFG